ncbi:tetratricopeptide repeat protein [Alishewanella tabrizica]|uniref:Tetratricopeptide repeat protein n=1 Tax=Alishewanella tabrizica TaxID=671278 RepID=A0ABQ2WSC8_9ALTE|nr:hypothetical protein [Alishewanella tabrizica]GGW69185.1 hypothetical protein GCM10008111_26610 [Alishewanella tabrizica]
MQRFIALLLLGVSYHSVATTALEQQVETLFQQKAYDDVKALIAPQVNNKTKDAFLLATLGRSELALGNATAAEKWLAKAVKADAANAKYQFWYGRASCDSAQQANMLSALGFAKRCVNAFEQAHQLAPENAVYLEALAKYYAQAPGVAGGDKDKAMALSKTLQQVEPLKGHLLELELLLQQDQTEAAKALIDQVPALQNRPEPYFMHGVKLAQSRDYAGAVQQFVHASKQDAIDTEAKRSRLLALYQLGRATVLAKTDYPQGIDALQRFLADEETLPEFNEWAQFRLAQLYLATEQRPAAETLLSALQNSTKDNTLKTEIKKIY